AFARPRTMRLTLPAISLTQSEDLDVDLAMSSRWYARGRAAGFRWVNQPFHLTGPTFGDFRYASQIIANLLSKHEGMFASINIRQPENISDGAGLYAAICKSLSRKDYRGFANFRLGVGFNITDYTPFFPFSDGPQSGVSVALESLPLIRREWERTHNLEEVAESLRAALGQAQDAFCGALTTSSLAYHGADWSLAPLPNGPESVVGLVEEISGNPVGGGGNLGTIARLTRCLKTPAAQGIRPTGFNGVMLSVLEDDVLASRFLHRAVSVNDLLLYSSVCGCGLDMVPIAGDTPEVAIGEYAFDTGHLAFRLDKPLGVRFLPISRLKAGQKTEFSHDFVCNSAVVSL
ncbi:MAG TPA: DUF711 family protein, partial [Aliiroseovarius sp.]|nr:DUF711 family protein [Aliiroseovarius sp.]